MTALLQYFIVGWSVVVLSALTPIYSYMLTPKDGK